MGVKLIVVHPKQHLPYLEGNNAEILKQLNLEFYNSLIPDCEKYGIKIATENMWQMDENKTPLNGAACQLVLHVN